MKKSFFIFSGMTGEKIPLLVEKWIKKNFSHF
jgi:hypothetical protein